MVKDASRDKDMTAMPGSESFACFVGGNGLDPKPLFHTPVSFKGDRVERHSTFLWRPQNPPLQIKVLGLVWIDSSSCEDMWNSD